LGDFDARAFGTGEWPRHLHSAACRCALWQRYLNITGMSLSTVEGLHLFYTLWEMIWLVFKRRHQPSIVITGTDYGTAVRIYLDKLSAAAAALTWQETVYPSDGSSRCRVVSVEESLLAKGAGSVYNACHAQSLDAPCGEIEAGVPAVSMVAARDKEETYGHRL
jgi:hypothetical protein